MLEILLLSFLCKKMGSLLRNKGWGTTFWLQLAVVVAWFGGMVFTGVAYGIYLVMTQGEGAVEHPNMFVAYPLCILGAGTAVGLLFTLVSFFPSHDLPPTWTITADAN